MKKHKFERKLTLDRETLLPLQREAMANVLGGQGQDPGGGDEKSRTWFQSVAFCQSNHCGNCGPRGRTPGGGGRTPRTR